MREKGGWACCEESGGGLSGRVAFAPCSSTGHSEMPLKDSFISDFSPISGSVFVVLLPWKH